MAQLLENPFQRCIKQQLNYEERKTKSPIALKNASRRGGNER
jgi:hypothetical protein